ncbi:unnamed protein product [Onchocerca ochengi]|uniref:ZP domain-containing protein n=1 Tax=Onchocerca ochengi TaxID=42157 RepID=A0A182E9N7_ONCOC|nr:unnamed protein product [Onchocerca ochengi]
MRDGAISYWPIGRGVVLIRCEIEVKSGDAPPLTGRSRFLAMTDSYSDGSNSEDDDNNNNKGHGVGNLNYSSLSNDDDDNDEHYRDDDSYDSDSSGHFALGNKSRSLP